MVELYKSGVYVLNGARIVPDTEDAQAILAKKMDRVPTKEEAKKQTISY